MRVLLVEDDLFSAELLQATLQQFGYEVTVATHAEEAVAELRTARYRMVVADWMLPGMSGVELCRWIRKRRTSRYVYVVLVTQMRGTESVVEGLRAGADDFIHKPFDPNELAVRLNAAERMLSLESRDLTIFSLAKLAESRDPETGAHLERIREYSRVLAEHLAQHPDFAEVIDGDYIELLYLTSPLHDIGKVGIPDCVLLKPGALTPEERKIMEQHAVIGGTTLDAAVAAYPDASFLRMARDIAWTHHEKFDGTGYPRGLAGEEIPLCGRIVAVADVYDALTTRRVYKGAFSHEKARQIIIEGRGTHFDPRIVDAYLANETRFLSIKERLEDPEIPLEPAAGVYSQA